MRLEITKEGTYVPEFNGNRDLPATEQITVRYRIPTIAIKSRCRSNPQAKAISGADGRIEKMEITIDKNELATLREMLIGIGNCSFGKSGGADNTITSAQDLIDAPVRFEPLLKEIVREFDRMLDGSALDEKN